MSANLLTPIIELVFQGGNAICQGQYHPIHNVMQCLEVSLHAMSFQDKIVISLEVVKPVLTRFRNSSALDRPWLWASLPFTLTWLLQELYWVKLISIPWSSHRVWNYFHNWTLHWPSCALSSCALSGSASSQRSGHIWDTWASSQWSGPSACAAAWRPRAWRVCSKWYTCMVFGWKLNWSWTWRCGRL